MGFDVLRFVNIGDILEDELICSICVGIYENPLVTPCDHMFCSRCIKRWFRERRTCPVCGTNISYLDGHLRPAPLVIRNILGKLKLSCEFNENGCEEIIRLDALESHISKCKHRPIQVQAKASFSQMFGNVLKFIFDRKTNDNRTPPQRPPGQIPVRPHPHIQENPFDFLNPIYGRLGFERVPRQNDNVDDGRNDGEAMHRGNQYPLETYIIAMIIFILGTYLLSNVINWLQAGFTSLGQVYADYPMSCVLAAGVFVFVWFQQNG